MRASVKRRAATNAAPPIIPMVDAGGNSIETFLTRKQVEALFGVSRMWIHRRLLDSNFPKPFYLPGRGKRFWKLSEVLDWRTRASAVPAPVCNAPGNVKGQ
jgi:predicted DNA-binding transcriptional regulator AlpA